MRIFEILLWNNETHERDLSTPQPDLPQDPFSDDLTNLANAFTRRGMIKHFWNVNGSAAQPSGPARPKLELSRSRAARWSRLGRPGRLSLAKPNSRLVIVGSFRFG